MSGLRKFKVRFGDGAHYRAVMPNSFRLHGKGFIQFEDNMVRFGGKRHRPFWFGVPEEHVVQQADILNARTTGKYVLFDIEKPGEIGHQVGFAASDRKTAEAIMSLLPRRRSEGFARDQAQLVDFHDRLNKLGRRAVVTPIIVALNVLVFILMVVGGADVLVPSPAIAIQWGSNYGPLTMDGQWWRLFTATFVHFGILHLAFNMLALYQTGQVVERLFGSARFLVLYIFSGLAGSVLSLLWHPLVNGAGASGAIFGVFGGLLALTLDSRNGVPRSLMTAHRTSTITFIAYNLFNGFLHAGIDNAAHIGGLLGGMAMGFVLARPIGLTAPAGVAKFKVATSGVIILLLGAGGYGLLYPSESVQQESRFQQQLDAFLAQEQKALDDTKRLFQTGTTSETEKLAFAKSMEQQVLPQWENMYRAFADATLSEQSPRYQLRQYLLRYLDDRRKSCRLFVDAVNRDDAQLMAQSNEFVKDAIAQIELIKQMPAK
jgi:rhomboid protease GluP